MFSPRVLSAFVRQRFRDLDQVEIGVAHVDRAQAVCRTGPLHRTRDDWPAARAQVFDHDVERPIGDEAQIKRARNRQMRFWFELAPAFVDVDLLRAELERVRPPAKVSTFIPSTRV